ncbi:MAG TPA: DUF5715 family protein [Longimicrobiales bacterium]|nr:DUF5715 family protein [Longimicrobiales bacterium]
MKPRIAAFAVCITLVPCSLSAQSLHGSPRSLTIQNRIARERGFTYLRTSKQVREFVEKGYLVPVRGDDDYSLKGVSFPYARPSTRTFVERIAAQYHAACGEKMVITSLTRPEARQPRNASSRSVHPTGMAIDIRRSRSQLCSSWLEDMLLSLEGSDVIEATRERHPPHYHVAVFPERYAVYVASLDKQGRTLSRLVAAVRRDDLHYTVKVGDSLWTIAEAHGVSVDTLKEANRLRTSRIYVGQVLMIPTPASR